MLGRHPAFRVNLHYSGSLFEWLDLHRPDVMEQLAVHEQQIEWMSGGFYEPILPAIPEDDRIAQLQRQSTFITERFDQVPRGVWLAERVWDPSLARTLRSAGLEYVPLDDYAFLVAGYATSDLNRSFIVDHLGDSVTVFPISENLRYAVPGLDPEEILTELRRRHDWRPDSLAVIADDGEKYGMWPGSAGRVYEPDNWLDRFFTAVEEADWLTITTFEGYLDEHPAVSRIALPPAGYREMAEWSLPRATARFVREAQPEAVEGTDCMRMEAFMRGGWWPNFLVEYPEANALYRKMLQVSKHLEGDKGPTDARTEVLKAQGHDTYWHGAFGGLYLPHLRAEAHSHLIAAQTMVDASHHRGRSWTYLRHLDWDADGRDEIRVELPDQSWVLDPAEGGCLLYRDDKPARWAISDVVARRYEPYHGEVEEDLIYDPHPRRWLVDHLLPAATSVEEFHTARYQELLPLPATEYVLEQAIEGRGSASVELAAFDGDIVKTIAADERAMRLEYHLADVPEGRFGPELPIAVWERAGHLRVDGGPWHEVANPLSLAGHRYRFWHSARNTTLLISLRQPGELFAIPIRTVVRTEDSFTTILQGVVLWPHWSTSGQASYEMTIDVGDSDPEAP